MIGKTTAQEHSEKLLIGNLYWPDMGTCGEATDVCALLVLYKKIRTRFPSVTGVYMGYREH